MHPSQVPRLTINEYADLKANNKLAFKSARKSAVNNDLNLCAPFLGLGRKIIDSGSSHVKMENTNEEPRLDEGTEDDVFVTPDFSVFRTQLPRPTSTMRHLVLAAVTFLLALVAAIFYAER